VQRRGATEMEGTAVRLVLRCSKHCCSKQYCRQDCKEGMAPLLEVPLVIGSLWGLLHDVLHHLRHLVLATQAATSGRGRTA